MKKSSSALAILAVSLSVARSAVLLNDSFSYPEGSLITNSGFVWITHNGTTGQTQVVAGKVQLSQSQSEDVSTYLGGQPYNSGGTTNVFYAAFTVRFSTLPSAAGDYFAHFKDVGVSSAFRARVWALTNGAAAGKFRLGISSTSGTVINATNSMDLSLNTDYRVVTRLANTNSIAALWINPTLESDPSVTTSEGSSAVTVAMYALRQSGGIGVLSLDDLAVGTSFADVVSNATPAAPFITVLPQSQTVTQGDNVTFTVRAGGTSPLSYQWKLDAGELVGATNSSLMLTNVTFDQAGDYTVTVTNSAGSTSSPPATLTVNAPSAPPVPGFSLLTYNTHGNFVADWTTNSAQVQAIGRQMQYLNPDIITFQEIPMTNSGWTNMPAFVTAFRPGFYLATNSVSDGFIRSVILSRWPITRSKSYLHSADLDPYGYTTNDFTRDLFEAQIAVPGFVQPLHVFTAHLKSGTSSSEDAVKRAAEASCISNFFITGFLTTNANHPYVLAGDMNEDIAFPATGSQQPIQRLTNGTGLRLTTPLNPVTLTNLTYSIQAALYRRYDYILPCTLLFSNILSSQVFRTDLLTNPPAPLLTNDDVTASDHLPVVMVFGNPYDKPFRILAFTRSNQTATLTWQSVPGQPYRVDTSSNLTTWSTLARNLVATNSTHSFSTNLSSSPRYLRVYRVP